MKKPAVLYSLLLFNLVLNAQNDFQAISQASNQEKIIQFKVRHNKIILPVQIGNTRILKIILDSGMGWDGILIMNPDLRDSIQLVSQFEARLGGAGEGDSQTALVSDSMDFFIGNNNFIDQRIVILQGESFKGFQSDGVTGYSLFGHYAVEINNSDSKIILHDPDNLQLDESWSEIPLYFKDYSIPWVDARVIINKEEPVPVSCYIDCASSETIELLLKPEQKFTIPEGAEDIYLGRGLSGDIYGKRGNITKVILGPYEITNIQAAFAPAEVRSKQKGADGVIANGLLRRFNIIFDYEHEKIYIKPNENFSDQ